MVDAVSAHPKTLAEKCAKAQLQQEQSKFKTVSWYSYSIKPVNSLNNNNLISSCVNVDIDNINGSVSNQVNNYNCSNSVENRQIVINNNKETEAPIDDNHQIQLYHQQIRQHYAQKENLVKAEAGNLAFYPIDNQIKPGSERLLSSLLPLSAQSSAISSK
jgi:hypothetical protein